MLGRPERPGRACSLCSRSPSAWRPDGADERRLITGLNFSPTLTNPFCSLGPHGPSLHQVLTSQRAGTDEPIIVLAHLACPIMAFTDRGKSQLDGATEEEIESLLDRRVELNALASDQLVRFIENQTGRKRHPQDRPREGSAGPHL